MGVRRGSKARSDSKWKDEFQRGEDEGRRPEVTLIGRMSPNGGKTRAEGRISAPGEW